MSSKFFYFCIFFLTTHARQYPSHYDYSAHMPRVPSSSCFSCASMGYLHVWNRFLMTEYYPPKNFTDRCWQPDMYVGSVPCTSACFTMVEEIFEHPSGQAVMRGCLDRLLLFSMDPDIKESITSIEETCRPIRRELLNLQQIHEDVSLVYLCTCVGAHCNKSNAEYMLNISIRNQLPFFSIFFCWIFLRLCFF